MFASRIEIAGERGLAALRETWPEPRSSRQTWSNANPLLELEAQPCDPGCRVASPTSLAFSHDGTKLAAALFNNNVQVWDLKTGRALITLGSHVRHDDIHSIDVAFSPDDRIIATGSEVGIAVEIDQQRCGGLVADRVKLG